MDDQERKILSDLGVFEYESAILLKKQGSDLASSVSNFCNNLDALGVETGEETEILLKAVGVLTDIDKKLRRAVESHRAAFFLTTGDERTGDNGKIVKTEAEKQ